MKLYRCDLCGRVFHEITPHVCVHGNYRKRNLTFTEFEDVDCEYVKKSEVDVKEKYFPNIPQGALMLEKPLEPKVEFMINWEQERVNIAQDAMLEMLKKMWDDTPFRRAIADSAAREGRLLPEYVATHCVEYADNLITALKNGTNEQ